ncbi:hypothetical protein ADUPG1_004728, partial [Aduncisulcus paluster]
MPPTRLQEKKAQGLLPMSKKITHNRNTRSKKAQDKEIQQLRKKHYKKQAKESGLDTESEDDLDQQAIQIQVPYKGNLLWHGQRKGGRPMSFTKETKAYFANDL